MKLFELYSQKLKLELLKFYTCMYTTVINSQKRQ